MKRVALKLREGVKKLPPARRAGRDIEKVLQRHLFTSTAYNEKLSSY
jgi:hypothetical protein